VTDRKSDATPGGSSVCPASYGRWLATSWRRLVQKPERMLAGFVEPGQTVADIGCGPGFFTIPMAQMVGETGRVIAIDLQEGMLALLRPRAERAGVMERIRLHRCSETELGLDETVDFALAFYVVHEVPNVAAFLDQVRGILRADGRLLIVEPVGHVSGAGFRKTIEIAHAHGFATVSEPRFAFSRAVLLGKD
jgi:ubiquinone/menaquinone biosynthesis C-methylase UbiE